VSELSQWKNGNTARGQFAERRAEKTGCGNSEHLATQVYTQRFNQAVLVGSRTGCVSLQCRHKKKFEEPPIPMCTCTPQLSLSPHVLR
jgi:acetyl/propionyl-CoA carboxylase alpha subunit